MPGKRRYLARTDGLNTLIEAREVLELAVARVNLGARQAAQALQAELLDGKAPHDRAVNDGAAHLVNGTGVVPGCLRGQIPHESPREAVAGAGGIVYLFDRQRRGEEGVALFINAGAVVAALDDYRFRAP